MRHLLWLHFSRIVIGVAAVVCILLGRTAWGDDPSPPAGAGAAKAVESVKAVESETKALAENPAAAPGASPAASPVQADAKPEQAAVSQTGAGSGPATGSPAVAAPAKVPKIHLAFRFMPWRDVLDWLARQADLSLVMESPPQGTFNYTDTRDYTPAEAIDLMNGVLLTKGFTLLRRDRMLMVLNIEDGIPANLVPTVPLDQLANKGESELVSVVFNLQQLKPEEAEVEIKKLLGPQGSVVSLAKARQVLVTDTGGRLRVVKSMLERIEGPTSTSSATDSSQIEIYPIVGADPQLVLKMLQTLFADQPRDVVRYDLDPKTNNLVVMARPAQQATVRAILAQLQREGQRIDVIPLTKVDPTTAVLLLNKLFGTGDPTKGANAGPQIDADPATRKLFIRGTESQIAQSRELLGKLGESLSAGGVQSGHIRTLPMSGSAAGSALDRMQEIWPKLRANEIRIVNPPSAISSGQPDEAKQPATVRPESFNRVPEPLPPSGPADGSPAPGEKPARPAVPESSKPAAHEHSADLFHGAKLVYVSEQSEAKSPAPIIVMPGPNGLTIASEDTEALDEFERLLGSMEGTVSSGREVTVLYLKHAKAESLAPMLEQMLGVATTSSASAASALPGQTPPASTAESSGLIMGRMGTNRTALATGPIKITPDMRLNALFVQANRSDLDTIQQLLTELDRKESPEDIALTPKPKMIPVYNTRANDVADIIRQVYVDRMVENPNAIAGQGVPGGPLGMMMRGMMGGGGGRGGRGGQQQGAQGARNDVVKLSLGVDTRTNSLIVAAPDTLFDEVKQLVEQLDTAAANEDETVRVVAVHGLSVSAVARAVEAMEGDSVQVNTTSALGSVLPAAQSPWGGGRPFGQQQVFRAGQQGGYQGGGGGNRQQQGGFQGGGGGFQGGGGGNRQQQGGFQGGGNRSGQQQSYQGGGGGNRQQGGYQGGGGGFQGGGGYQGGGGFQGGGGNRQQGGGGMQGGQRGQTGQGGQNRGGGIQ
jgi:type II secretory pathway component GspD/PulD (secretin)